MSRRSTSLIILLVAFALVVAACSSDSEAETTTTEATTTSEVTTTTGATTTTPEPTTTTTEATTTTSEDPVDPPSATLAISEVGFGSAGYVEITNISDSTASLDGLWLCQQPSYHALSGTLEPGESLRFEAADSTLGALNADGGAMGLYTSSDFGSSDAIIGYVAWGPSGHGRLGVAITAEVWTEDSSVDATGASLISTTEPAPISAEGWATG
jgi:ABC-type transport system substrate-binding protein